MSPIRRPRQGSSAKRNRRRAPPGQGRLERCEITAADVAWRCRCRQHPGNDPSFAQWLKSTLQFVGSADQHYGSNTTLRAKKVDSHSSLGRKCRGCASISTKLTSDGICSGLHCKCLFWRKTTADDGSVRTNLSHGVRGARCRSAINHIGWLEKLLQHDLKHLERRPETGDERRAREQAASKPAIKHLTLMIVNYWRVQLRREAEPAAMADFAAAVFRLAGDRGISRATAVERLKVCLRSRAR